MQRSLEHVAPSRLHGDTLTSHRADLYRLSVRCTETTLVLVPPKLRAGWVAAAELSGSGVLITLPDPATRTAVMDAILFHFVNRLDLYPTRTDAVPAAGGILARCLCAPRSSERG